MIQQAIAFQVLEGACKSFVAGGVSVEDFRLQMIQLLQLVPVKPESTTDITLSHADLPGVITEALRASAISRNMQIASFEVDPFRELAKDVSKALVLHARRNGG